jgi:CHAD domain-containing protein
MTTMAVERFAPTILQTPADPAPVTAELEDGERETDVLTCGGFARELIHSQVRRLGKLQAEVRADRDPEPLHQLRVSLRRLRTALDQFAPALDLPEGVSERRVAAVARRTGLCRDLDVLTLRLRDQILPPLPARERHALKGAMKRLGQDREKAREALLDTLHSPRYLKLLARLHSWHGQPRFTPLGDQPLEPWLQEWQAPATAGLFLHAGWREENPEADSLHDLRKRIKRARYGLEPLERWCSTALKTWIEELREAQDHLGELHDLQILHHGFVARGTHGPADLPVLHAELDTLRRHHWQAWRALAQRLCAHRNRRTIHRDLLALGAAAEAADAEG